MFAIKGNLERGLKLVKTVVSKLGFFKIGLTKATKAQDRANEKTLIYILQNPCPKTVKNIFREMCGNNNQRGSSSLQLSEYIH